MEREQNTLSPILRSMEKMGLRNEEGSMSILKVYHHINQPRKRVDEVEMGKNVCKKVEMGETG